MRRKEAAKTFDKFQKLKYNDINKWSDLKQLYKDVNWQTKAQSNIIKGSEHKVPFNAEPNSVFDNYKEMIIWNWENLIAYWN